MVTLGKTDRGAADIVVTTWRLKPYRTLELKVTLGYRGLGIGPRSRFGSRGHLNSYMS